MATFCQAGFAQDLIAPQPITSPQPPQPTNATGQVIDGWVTVRYSVLANGTPANVRVANVMPPSIDPAPTLASFSEWRFTPGTRDGSAIDWHNNEIKVTYRSQGGMSPTADAFAASYAAISDQMESEDYEAALAASDQLIASNASRMSELGLALVQNAFIHRELGDWYSALGPLQMATDPQLPMLSGVELYPALQLRMSVEQNLSRTQDALESYKRLARAVGGQDQALAQQGEAMANAWEQAPLLEVKGRIDDGSWRLDAGRRFFFIDGIDGRITTIDAECDTRRLSLEFDPSADYQLPTSFGDCTLFLHGDDGTRFSLIEALPPAEG
jgi:hypothetical protein